MAAAKCPPTWQLSVNAVAISTLIPLVTWGIVSDLQVVLIVDTALLH